jgi:TRAP-type uncharacterized transport system substrate-binding protein
MQAGPRRPPLAMRLWLAQRFGLAGKTASSAVAGHTLSKNIESLEHAVRSRVRLFLRNTWLVAILGTVVLTACFWASFYFVGKPTQMTIAVGPPGGIDAKLVQLLVEKTAASPDKIHVKLVATAGPAQSAEAIAGRGADLAVLPANLDRSQDWPVVAILRQNVMAFIVPAVAPGASETKEAPLADKKETNGAAPSDSDGGSAKPAVGSKSAKNGKQAKSGDSEEDADASDSDDASGKLTKIPQLSGRRIGILGGTDANVDLLTLVLQHYGVAPDKVQVSYLDPGDLAATVRGHAVDAIFVAGPATGHAIGDAVAAVSREGGAPSFIAIGQAEGIAKRNPAFDAVEIDAGTFGGNPPAPADNLKTLSFPEYLVARRTLDKDDVNALARLIYNSRLALAAAQPGDVKIEAPKTDKDAAVMVHPGAASYLTEDQKSFFDKYGDDIFYGLLIFPLFGSAIAAVAGYLRHSHRTRRLRLLQRLIDLVRKAHAAPSLEALDRLQIDLDNLVIAIIHQGEHQEYDDTVQTSFTLALDQARFAIAARRVILLDRGGAGADKAGAKTVPA